MPWKECDKVTERMKFVARLSEGEKMTDLCREFGISRVTGYKIWHRYEEEGIEAINDRSRRPWRLARITPSTVEKAILAVKHEHRTWGAPKIHAYLGRKEPSMKLPARSTVHAILDRHGLVVHRQRRKSIKAKGSPLRTVANANDLWCADFKGHFRLSNNKLCYPLTVTDQHTRYLLGCEALDTCREKQAIECFKQVFKEYGLPRAIRTDNGVPFSARSLFGLSKLSVLWLRLGIEIERIKPGHPEQNGRHERMHRTLKAATVKPQAENLLQQQERFERFKCIFNDDRPHEALEMKSPSDLYEPSARRYPSVLDDYEYDSEMWIRRVAACGTISINGNTKLFISQALAGQYLGLREEEEGIWAVYFMNYRLGYHDRAAGHFNEGPNPFFEYRDCKL